MASHDEQIDHGELADAVTALRDAVRDLKHDVRMLKVGLDRQQRMLEHLTRGAGGASAGRRDGGRRRAGRDVRLGDQPAGTTGDDDATHRRAG